MERAGNAPYRGFRAILTDSDASPQCRARWVAGLALAAVATIGFAFGALVPASGESTAVALANARSRLQALRSESDTIALRFERALQRQAEIEDAIVATQLGINRAEMSKKAAHGAFNTVVGRLYMTGSRSSGATGEYDHGANVLENARADQYANTLASNDRSIIEKFTRISATLDTARHRFETQRREQTQVLADLRSQLKQLDAKLIEANRIERRFGRQLSEEVAAARRAAIARRDATSSITTSASSRPQPGTNPAPTAPSPTRPAPTPTTQPRPNGGGNPSSGDTSTGSPSTGSGAYGMTTCPVQGPVSFIDSWGAPRPGGRNHEGVDMMSPEGTPVVAVASGTISQRYGSNQGNGIFFSADNGNSFWYFHLSRYAGAPRHAKAGEVIGYVGHTGATLANHLHFEIHPGGAGPISPFGPVSTVC